MNAVRAKASLTSSDLEIYLWTEDQAGRIYPARMQSTEEAAIMGTEIPETTQITREAAQNLMQDLWDAGVRPKSKPESSPLVQAKEKHIEHLYELARLALAK